MKLLSTVRHLKESGVEVRFEKEHIHSFSGDGEMMLSILASFAQEESRSISENSKWGIRKRYQSGENGVKNKRVFGYSYDGEKYEVVAEEAEAVRLIIYQFGEQSKAETCASLSAILPQIKDSNTKQIVSSTLKKLNALSEETCAELTVTTKRRKITERDHSIKTRLARVKEQSKQQTVAEGKSTEPTARGRGIWHYETVTIRTRNHSQLQCRRKNRHCLHKGQGS